MAKKVAVPEGMIAAGSEYLIERGYEVITTKSDQQDILAKAKDVDGIILYTEPIDNSTIDAMPNLKILARHGVGYDNIDYDYAASKGIWTTITPNANAGTVAESTLAMMLDVSKNITQLSLSYRNGTGRSQAIGFDLEGKTLGIMGFGRIGSLVAKKASGLGMNVLAYSRTKKDTPYAKFVDRDTIIKESDVLSLHMAVTDETIHGIGAAEFKQMKDSAVLINLGRGALVDQDALITALKAGEIAGAGLDVTEPEPLPRDSELFELPNVVLTPHVASNTVESMTRMAVGAASEIDRVLQGDQPKWALVDINK
ncbi:phosphoglycerate dehydrogenase [Lentilactobacillus sp. Marseille-Q4993]|uniref:phosphoglycerate dehydrogenase n=1 Tax=Lentilactobacillus sp. Marseille-Q4993 TaxID=3039492 RepID=UPI0024BC3FE3|nr:phosphoglycerate dehydrogenase [Lentilactobacillus sp. Marseille-Q4993]